MYGFFYFNYNLLKMPFSIRISIFCEPIQKRKTNTFRILFVVASRVFAVEQFGIQRWKANQKTNLMIVLNKIRTIIQPEKLRNMFERIQIKKKRMTGRAIGANRSHCSFAHKKRAICSKNLRADSQSCYFLPDFLYDCMYFSSSFYIQSITEFCTSSMVIFFVFSKFYPTQK